MNALSETSAPAAVRAAPVRLVRSWRFWRRLTQIGAALAFVGIPFLNSLEIHVISGNFLSFTAAGLPLADPLAALQVLLLLAPGAVSGVQALLAGAGLVLLMALLLGPAFCAWICPFGLLSELAARKNGPRGNGQQGRIAPSGAPFGLKLLLTALGLAAALALSLPLLNQLSLPGWYSRALQHLALYRELLWGALLLPLVLLVERLAGARLWCRYICPQSVLISLAGLLLPGRLRVHFARRACTCPAKARACLSVCGLRLNPRAPQSKLQRLQCTNCGDCVDACRSRGGALRLGQRAGSD